MRKIQLIAAMAITVFFIGCMNMPTQPSQITSAYTPTSIYQHLDCQQLGNEMRHLTRRENQLVTAQEQRYKTSQMQAFWWGFGQGDGVEASELANVRGEREAVRHVMEDKNCHMISSK